MSRALTPFSTRFAPWLLALGLGLGLGTAAHAEAPDAADAGLALVDSLGQLNGQALACSQLPTVSRIKGLMIRHAPKTARYGSAFETSTNRAFLAQGQEAVCPEAAALAARVDEAATRLATLFPATP